MKKMKYIFAGVVAVALVAAVSSCTKNTDGPLDPDKEQYRKALLQEAECGLWVAGQTDVQFEKALHQMYFSGKDRTFRMMDNDAEKYVELILNSTPEMGGEVVGEVKSNGLVKKVGNGAKTFYVLKKDSDKAWLWCDSEAFGAVVLWIE